MNLKFKIVSVIINLISKTWRVRYSKMPPQPAVIAFWHGFMMGAWKQFSHHSSYAVISRSNDGELLSTLLKKWGFSLLRGSSARGGSEILADMVEVSKKHYLLITPDGPQGPAYNFKAGAVIAAQRSGSPLYLCSIKSTQALYFRKSWDSFCFPLPFSRVEINFSEPVMVSAVLNREEITELITLCEERMRVMQLGDC